MIVSHVPHAFEFISFASSAEKQHKTTTRIQFVFLFLFKFCIPSGVKITIALISMRQARPKVITLRINISRDTFLFGDSSLYFGTKTLRFAMRITDNKIFCVSCNLVPRASITLVQRERRGRLCKNPKPEPPNPGSGLSAPA